MMQDAHSFWDRAAIHEPRHSMREVCSAVDSKAAISASVKSADPRPTLSFRFFLNPRPEPLARRIVLTNGIEFNHAYQ